MAVALASPTTKKTSKSASSANHARRRRPNAWFDSWGEGPYTLRAVMKEIANSADPQKAKEAFHYTDERTHERVTFAAFEAAQENGE